VVAEFEVPGEAVPYSGSRALGRGRVVTEPKFKSWKEELARHVHGLGLGQANGRDPYRGPVEVVVYLCRACPRGRRPGDVWDTKPDVDNLYKGIPDAISGNVFKAAVKGGAEDGGDLPACAAPPSPVGRLLADDKQVTDVTVRKRYWFRPLVFVRVVAAAPRDLGPYPFGP
jgi:Holliday junction resolvase RusA-like endonuclease